MKRWLTASLLMTLALLAGGEIVMRVFFARSMTGRFEYGYNPTAGFVENADGMVSLVRTGGRRFRPQTFSRTRPAGTFRIMVFGDSVPRGESLETSYPWKIAEQLQVQGTAAEGINLGLGGNGSRRNQIVLRQALHYKPSLVILHVNNSNEFEDERELRRAHEFSSWHPRNWLMKSLFVRRLYEAKTEQVFWKWLPGEIRDQAAVSDADAELKSSLDEKLVREWNERVRQKTIEDIDMARQSGAAVLLVTQAGPKRQADGSLRFEATNSLDEMVMPMLGPGVWRVSMKDIFAHPGGEEEYADGAHLRPGGHRLLAAAIVEKLRQEGVITNTGSR